MATLADLEAALTKVKAGRIPPLILIYGDQDYLVKQAYDRLLEAIVPLELRSFNLEQLDGARCEASQVLDAFNIVPMMPGPKAVGVPEARFFQSKTNGAELLMKSKEAWEKQETSTSLRSLARLLALLGVGWTETQGYKAADFAQALESDAVSESSHGGMWLEKALAQGLASEFPLPPAADESGELLSGLESSMSGGEDFARALVFAASAADARKKLVKFIQEKGLVLEFKSERRGPQASQTASVFLRNLLGGRGLKMSSSLGSRFVGAYGHDLGLMVKELDKLECYAGERKDLSEADLAAVGSPQPEDTVFDLLEALGRREKGLGSALPLLKDLLRREPAQMIFSMLVSEARMLLLCRALIDEGKVAARNITQYPPYKASVHPKLALELPEGLREQFKRKHPFAAYQAFQRCQSFDLATLKKVLGAALEADLRLKTSSSDAGAELEELCLRLCGVEEEVYL